MSRLWPKAAAFARIALAPGWVGVRAAGALHEAQVETPNWLATVEALERLARRIHLRAQAVEVVLSHHFAPVWLAPPPPARLPPAEQSAWAEAWLADTLGDLGKGLRVVADPVPHGQPMPLAALPGNDLAALLAESGKQELVLRRVRPWLAELSDAHRSTLRRHHGWLAVLEPGRLVLAGVEHGRFRTLASMRLGAVAGADIEQLIARESLRFSPNAKAPLLLASALQQVDAQGITSHFAGRHALRWLGRADLGLAGMLGGG